MNQTKIPAVKAVRDLFGDLIGLDVSVSPGEPVALGQDSTGIATVYVTEQLAVSAVALLDLALTAYLGSALGLLPPAGVQDLLAEGEVSKSALENVEEVLNIVSALFNVQGAPHVKLYSVILPGDLPPADISEVLHSWGRRLDLTVNVPGYGSGAFSLALA
ncbi:MAG TPA: hypothetical protein VMV52_08680 [Candidatus Nanopelagicaceae bacterium]|nr:hypothetical protein [Candidatus Nanopelagicaceae bacterium]